MRRSSLPPLWHDILNTATITEMRKFVLTAFEVSKKALQIDKSDLTQFYLGDIWLRELKEMNFAPGGKILVFDWLMRGISILAFMN